MAFCVVWLGLTEKVGLGRFVVKVCSKGGSNLDTKRKDL